jgi:hypothetical protein
MEWLFTVKSPLEADLLDDKALLEAVEGTK